ncbi:MAG: acyl-CoA thioesterase [Candidatus Omnitrophica bacterium CG07_land_8_20_14_0_80_50_8]|nr:MAG: acyl-CoA thioesterase [Candidatus Omnitrophica bacterium CG07_land_8_20_14_0_80_50_8]
MAEKKVSESKTEMSQLMMPQHANFGGTIYGGTILSIADSVAYVCAARHAGPNCVTVSVDRVDFRKPIRIGELVTFLASVNFVGHSSMEVGIKIFSENLGTGQKRHTNSCYFTMVCLNDQRKPKEVPRLVPETADEKRRYEAGRKRHEAARK